MLERIEAAATAGFEGVEILFPYDEPAPEVRNALIMASLPLVLINCPPPNYTGGARGFAAQSKQKDRFRRDFKRALRYVETLRAQRLHIMAGEAEGPEAHACFVENLAWAATTAPEVSLTIEPINTDDMPGYFLNDFDMAAEILDEVAAPNLTLQFDAYHAHKITGDVSGTWERHHTRVTHIQIAGAEGRHEPSAGGAIDYPAFFKAVDAVGYAGYISAEYFPAGRTEDGLAWLTDLR